MIVEGEPDPVATVDAAHLDVGRSSSVTSFDADLLEQGAPGLFRRDPVYASDEAATWRSLICPMPPRPSQMPVSDSSVDPVDFMFVPG